MTARWGLKVEGRIRRTSIESYRTPMNDGKSRRDYVEAGYAGVEVGNATEEGDAGKRGKSRYTLSLGEVTSRSTRNAVRKAC